MRLNRRLMACLLCLLLQPGGSLWSIAAESPAAWCPIHGEMICGCPEMCLVGGHSAPAPRDGDSGSRRVEACHRSAQGDAGSGQECQLRPGCGSEDVRASASVDPFLPAEDFSWQCRMLLSDWSGPPAPGSLERHTQPPLRPPNA